MKKTKILFIHHGIGVGGAAISLAQMIKDLDKQSFTTNLVFMENSEATCFYKQIGIKIDETLNIPCFSHTVIWWYSITRVLHMLKASFGILKTSFKAPGLLKKYQPNILHLNSSPAWPWAIVGKIMGYKVVTHIREPLAAGYFGVRKFFIAKIINLMSDKILAISKNEALPWQDNPKLSVLYNAVDENRFNLINLENKFLNFEKKTDQDLIFLYAGGASAEKGASFLISFWQEVVKQKLPAILWIAGKWIEPCKKKWGFSTPGSKFYQSLESLAEPIKQKIKFLGLSTNIEEAMFRSDALLFPCQKGHFARPVIEAAFLKKPSLASNLAPLDEIILNNQTGLLLPFNDQDSWVNAIKNLCLNRQTLEFYGNNAYNFIKPKMNLKYQIEQLEQIYNSIHSL